MPTALATWAVESFALTANNITYAKFGDAMNYWQFFPTGEDGWGCIPVWGFARVVESQCDGIAVGEKLYGYFPMGTHLVVEPARIKPESFFDGSAPPGAGGGLQPADPLRSRSVLRRNRASR